MDGVECANMKEVIKAGIASNDMFLIDLDCSVCCHAHHPRFEFGAFETRTPQKNVAAFHQGVKSVGPKHQFKNAMPYSKPHKAEKISTETLVDDTMNVIGEMLTIMVERINCDNNDMGGSLFSV